MPTYEYECTKCGAVVEIFQSITEPARKKLKKDDPRACACEAPVQRRIGGGAGLIFKGSGFYVTDYRSDSYKKAASAEKGSTDGAPKSKSSDASTTPSKTTGKESGASTSADSD